MHTKSTGGDIYKKKKIHGERTLTTATLDTGLRRRRRSRVCLIEQLRAAMVVRHRLPRGFKKKKIEEESDAGGAGFKAQAAHWLTAVHWRDGEGERESGGGGVERVLELMEMGRWRGGGYHRRAPG